MDYTSTKDASIASDKSSENYLKKVKKQAKRLYQFAQKNQKEQKLTKNTITINSLSEAQEILAQMNGYPNWHALEKNVSKDVRTTNNQPLEMSNKEKRQSYKLSQQLDKFYYYEQEMNGTSYICSVFNINSLGSQHSAEQFIKDLNEIIYKIKFQFNMGFHNIQFYLSKENESSIIEETAFLKNYSMLNISKEWNIKESLVKSLFTVNVSTPQTKEEEKKFNIIFVASTEESMREEHIPFCKILSEAFDYKIENRDFLSQHEYDLLIKKENTKKEFNFVLDKNNDNENKAIWNNLSEGIWIQVIHLLSDKNYGWDISVDINQKKFRIYYEEMKEEKENEKIKKYLQGLIYNLMNGNSKEMVVNMFNYPHQYIKAKNNFIEKEGLAFVSPINDKLNYYKRLKNPYSSELDLIYAKPGSGKSTLLNIHKLEALLSGNVENIPYMMSLDVGPSYAGLLSFIKEALPSHKKNLVKHYMFDMTAQFAVNIFDTQLGSRYPTIMEKKILSNFIIAMLEDGYNNMPMPMTALVNELIDNAYQTFSDNGTPKRYDRGIVKEVDKILKDQNKSITLKTTWWEIVDFLFINGFVKEAKLAQRHAVPLLGDLGHFTNAKIMDKYRSLQVATGENLIQYFFRKQSDTLNYYRVFVGPTVFDVDDDHIVFLDLDKVMKSGGVKNNHQSTLMYLLGNHLLTNRFRKNRRVEGDYAYTNSSTNIDLQNKYIQYHHTQIKNIPILLYLDEYHRANSANSVEKQILQQVIEARKYNMSMTICSQSITDFKKFNNLATGVFLLEGGNGQDVQNIADQFNLNLFEKQCLSRGKVHGPRGKNPAVMLAKIKTEEGWKSNLLRVAVSPHLLCTLSTTYEDVILKNNLMKTMPFEVVINLLVEHYPFGIKKQIDQLYESEKNKIEKKSISDILEEITNQINKTQLSNIVRKKL